MLPLCAMTKSKPCTTCIALIRLGVLGCERIVFCSATKDTLSRTLPASIRRTAGVCPRGSTAGRRWDWWAYLISPAAGDAHCSIDIIGNSVQSLHANLHHLTRQTARVSCRDRTDACRVCASAASLCYCLCGAVSTGQDLGGQAAPTSSRGRGHWRFATDGRQTAVPARFSEDQCVANYAWLAIRSEPTPDQLLDSSLTARSAARLAGDGTGSGARCAPCRDEPFGFGMCPPPGGGWHRTPPPTPTSRRHAKGPLQRQEKDAYRQKHPPDQRTHGQSRLSGADTAGQATRQEGGG